METSSRMRRCLKRNYRGYDHLGAAANYDDNLGKNSNQSTPILSAEAISIEGVNEDEEQVEMENLDARVNDIEDKVVNHPTFSRAAEQTEQESLETSATELASVEGIVQSSLAIAPGYVPSELDERIVLELPSSMVQPLKVLQGTFQVSLFGLI